MVLTDDEIADMSLYSPPFSDTPRNTHLVSEVLKRDIAHNFGNDTDTNRIIEYEYDMMYNMSEKAIKGTLIEHMIFVKTLLTWSNISKYTHSTPQIRIIR